MGRLESDGFRRVLRDLRAPDANVDALGSDRRVVFGLLGRDDPDEPLGDVAEEFQAEAVQGLGHDLRVGGVLGSVDAPELVPRRDEEGQRVDLEDGVLVRIDEGVDEIDVAANGVLEQLLSRAELTGGEILHAQSDVRAFDVRLDLFEHLVPVMLDGEDAGDLEGDVGRHGLDRRRQGEEQPCGGCWNPGYSHALLLGAESGRPAAYPVSSARVPHSCGGKGVRIFPTKSPNASTGANASTAAVLAATPCDPARAAGRPVIPASFMRAVVRRLADALEVLGGSLRRSRTKYHELPSVAIPCQPKPAAPPTAGSWSVRGGRGGQGPPWPSSRPRRQP